MRAKDVPQQTNPTLDGSRKAMYAVGDDGKYQIVPSAGWEVEETVTTLAIADFQDKADHALRLARQGQASPLAYHMYRCRMDEKTLAQSSGLALWRVRRHLQPARFKRLKPALIQRYADALGLSRSELCQLPSEPL